MKSPSQPIVVYSLPPILLTNPYLDQLYAPMPDLGILVRRGRPRTELPRLLLGREPRILHLHFFDELTQHSSAMQTAIRSIALLGVLAAMRARGVRQVWTAHNLVPHEMRHPRWANVVYRAVAHSSAAIIAHSQAARALLEERYGSLPQITVIPHGSSIGTYGPMRGTSESRAALGLPATGPVTLAVGALRPYKGLDDVLAAFAALPPESRGTLLIAGAAKDRAYADALVRQAAPIAGARVQAEFVPDDALATYFAAADLVALPYRRLLTSGALLTAFSYARPVLAPALPPVAELVHEGENGVLFAPGDLRALTTALARALAHPNLGQLGEGALATARRFDWGTIAAQTAAVYREVAAGV